MEEIWRDVEGYEGLYWVSNIGNVKNKKKELSPSIDAKGYKRVGLYKDKKRKHLLIHRLVAIAFIENIEDLPCVNHTDSNPSNCEVTNLEWCTQSENIKYAYDNGFMNRESQYKPVVKIDKETGKIVSEYKSMSEACKELGNNTYEEISGATSRIGNCIRGRIETAFGYKWEFI